MSNKKSLLNNALVLGYKYLPAIIIICFGCLFLIKEMTSFTIKNTDDLIFLKGEVENYSFKIKRQSRRTTKSYDFNITLKDYPCEFKINADFINYFLKRDFEINVKPGDSITLAIPKAEEHLTGNHERLMVMGISEGNQTYLNPSITVMEENSNTRIYLGILSLVIGITLYIMIWKGIINNFKRYFSNNDQ
ncbi:MAG: hypothetical protein EOO45_06640 [Flavobacterium sp.]|nr:MAG: hypothetical protein EOO45_06640 [Flavobacterium sp.]